MVAFRKEQIKWDELQTRFGGMMGGSQGQFSFLDDGKIYLKVQVVELPVQRVGAHLVVSLEKPINEKVTLRPVPERPGFYEVNLNHLSELAGKYLTVSGTSLVHGYCEISAQWICGFA